MRASLNVSQLSVPGRFTGSLAVERGRVLAVVGASGSGKTTLLEALAGVIPASGSIVWDGQELAHLPPQSRPTGLVPQTPIVFPSMTVEQNVGFGLDDSAMPNHIRSARIEIALAEMRISGLASRKPSTLSGGQAQRTALARTLARRPEILLLDEPLAHIDAHLRTDLHEVLVRHTQEHNSATIYATHDVTEAFYVGDEIAILHRGHLLQVAPPQELYARPSSRHVAHILGISNIFSCYVLSNSGGECSVRVADEVLRARGEVSCGPALVCFPPESVHITQCDDGIPGQVLQATFARSNMWYRIQTSFGTVNATGSTHTPLPAGLDVSLSIADPWIIPDDA